MNIGEVRCYTCKTNTMARGKTFEDKKHKFTEMICSGCKKTCEVVTHKVSGRLRVSKYSHRLREFAQEVVLRKCPYAVGCVKEVYESIDCESSSRYHIKCKEHRQFSVGCTLEEAADNWDSYNFWAM